MTYLPRTDHRGRLTLGKRGTKFTQIQYTTLLDTHEHARLALNYKGLAFRTQWVEYPDIRSTLQPLVPPNADGIPSSYSVPAITDLASSDGSTPGPTIMGSEAIAAYLDITYPSRPLFRGSPASRVAQQELINLVEPKVLGRMLYVDQPALVTDILNPKGAEWFRRTREEKHEGRTLEELASPSEEQWRKVEAGLDELDAFIGKSDREDLEVVLARTGGADEPTFATFVVAGPLIWIQKVAPPDVWARIMTAKDGRWARFMASVKPYTA